MYGVCVGGRWAVMCVCECVCDDLGVVHGGPSLSSFFPLPPHPLSFSLPSPSPSPSPLVNILTRTSVMAGVQEGL